MEMLSEQERYANGNILRDLGLRALDKVAVILDNLLDIDEAMDVFEE